MTVVAEMDFDGAHGHVWYDDVGSLHDELRLLRFEACTSWRSLRISARWSLGVIFESDVARDVSHPLFHT